MRSKTSVRYISTFILLLVLLFSIITIAQGKDLDIKITDLADHDISQINEGNFFKVSVLDPESEEATPFLSGVTIEFNSNFYQIDETLELMLTAPDVDEDTSVIITATKEGYNSTNKSIIILDNETEENLIQLVITPEKYTVDAGEKFSVLIKDEDDNPISEAMVGIQSFGDLKITDDDGRAWLTAPENDETITIIAQKEGYSNGDIDIKVNLDPPWIEPIIKNPYFIISIAVILLIIVVIFVNYRQKKSVFNRAKEISNNKTMERFGDTEDQSSSENNHGDTSTIKDGVRIKPDEDPKVEEIRISRPRKEKEVVDVETEADKTEKVIKKKEQQKRDYDWFEGTEDMRYEIDKLTGEVDEEGLDKWYEGVEGLKEKIDEKVKKKDKKKNGEK